MPNTTFSPFFCYFRVNAIRTTMLDEWYFHFLLTSALASGVLSYSQIGEHYCGYSECVERPAVLHCM